MTNTTSIVPGALERTAHYRQQLTMLHSLKPRPAGSRWGATFIPEKGSDMQRTNPARGAESMAKVIEFYVPQDFTRHPKTSGKRGQVIEFVIQRKKSA
jgi:hypothetical protein